VQGVLPNVAWHDFWDEDDPAVLVFVGLTAHEIDNEPRDEVIRRNQAHQLNAAIPSPSLLPEPAIVVVLKVHRDSQNVGIDTGIITVKAHPRDA